MGKRAARITHLPGRNLPYRVRWWEHDNRCTKHFKTQGEAAQFASEHGMEDHLGDLAITGSERIAIVRIRQAAGEAGVSIDTLVEKALDAAQAMKVQQSTTVAAKDAFLHDCEIRNLRQTTVAHYRSKIGRFILGREQRLVSEITRNEMTAWILGAYQSPESRFTVRTPLMAWMRWCGRKGLVDPNLWRDPLKWETTLSDGKSIGILRPAQLYLLMRRLPERLRFPLAVCCFTGLRPRGELERLRWDMIDRRRQVIDIPGEVDKIRRGRTLQDLPGIFWQWEEWERRRQGGDAQGRVLPITYRHYRVQVRKAMEGLGEWPHDATRHSFGSYGYHYQGMEMTVEHMGHVGGNGLFLKRYKASARAATARQWFERVRPERVAAP